jgi:predicted NBD/HSP70 family sugar kinase
MNTAVPPIGFMPTPAFVRPITPAGRAILGALLRSGSLSQAELPARIEIAQPSAARLVGILRGDGLVALSSRKATGRGNPSVSLSLDPNGAYAFGIGLVGDAVLLVLLDLAGHVRATRHVAMPDMTRAKVIEVLKGLVADVLAATGIDEGRLIGAGVGFSGFFVGDPPRFNPPAPLADWADTDVAATLSDPLGMPVVCDNDGTTAAIAEAMLGVGRRSANFAYFHLTNGFGGGLIVGGRPLRGAEGNAADFGGAWWLLDQGYPSLERLRTLTRNAGSAFETVERMIRSIDLETPGVSEWMAEAERPFAMLASLLGHIVAPEHIVIGGRLPASLAKALATRLRLPQTPSRNDQPFPLPSIVASEVEGDATAIGAAAMALQSVFFD